MTILQLSPPLLIASGGHRACYRHPDNSQLCIKVHHQDNGAGRVETDRELRFYRFLKNRSLPQVIVPGYYGTVSTNLGAGYVYQRVTDYDNRTSKTLEEYLQSWLAHEDQLEWLAQAWRQFKREAREGWLVSKKLHPYNLMVCEYAPGQRRIIVVDNMGSSAALPVAYYSRLLARAELSKRCRAFQKLVRQHYQFSL